MKLQFAFSYFLCLVLDSTSSFQVNYSRTTAGQRIPQLKEISFQKQSLSPYKNLKKNCFRDEISNQSCLTLNNSKGNDEEEVTTEETAQASDGGDEDVKELPELTPDELNLISTIATSDTSSLDQFLMTNLSNMPSHVTLTLRNAAEGNFPSYKSTTLTKEQCSHLQSVGKALVEIMDVNLQAGRDLLQSFLGCGEIRKLDAAIGKAMKEDKLNMGFFTVLNMNIRDAAMEQVDEGGGLSKTEEGEFSTGDNANRYQILQHIYTRCQEEVEKVVSPGSGLLNKLLRTEQSSIRSNQLSHYLCPQAPKTISSPDGTSVELPGSKALVKPSELIEALKNAIRQIRTVEKTGTVDRAAAVGLVESCRQIAIEARFAIGEGYGVDSEELKEFEVSLQPVFRPESAESEFIAGVE